MRVCPKCGHRDNPYWRNSRFEFNAEYMSREDFKREYPKIWDKLKDLPNHHPVTVEYYLYYNRGRKEQQVYRVEPHDYKVPRK